MKKWIILTVLAGIAMRIARKYNIGFESFKSMFSPKLENLTSKARFN